MVGKPDGVMTGADLTSCQAASGGAGYKQAQEGAVSGQDVSRHWQFHDAGADRWLTRSAMKQRHRESDAADI